MIVVVVWFCRSSSLTFLISAYLIILMHQFLLHWVFCFGGCLFVHTPVFFWKLLEFFVFFHLFLIWQTIMPKLWMSGVGTLCAIAPYRAALLYFVRDFGSAKRQQYGSVLIRDTSRIWWRWLEPKGPVDSESWSLLEVIVINCKSGRFYRKQFKFIYGLTNMVEWYLNYFSKTWVFYCQ